MVHEHILRSITSHSSDQTVALGEWLGRHLSMGTCLALDGDLGAGKTTLTRGIGLGLGGYPVSSPSYTLHDLHQGGRLTLSHCDAWMEDREVAFLEDGGTEWLLGEGISVVEWADRVTEWLPSPRLGIRLLHQTPSSRLLEFRVLGPEGPPEGLCAALMDLIRDLPESGESS
ncbi:MAG: tRNA (adenosine(37)-N6)-threonylcarbamoyltransferase complex ATPase subunit type 1 TsaE [Planctomycetota bacterium]|nr:tRNA (adenosine(37)-N6)-threonylcarbamoyltransferase complex ATPase subunit type 1 TsaE [Planctomycetota bacterium]